MRYFLLEVDDVDTASVREYTSMDEVVENASFDTSTVAGPFILTIDDDGTIAVECIVEEDDDE
jgi:hypothetical protein